MAPKSSSKSTSITQTDDWHAAIGSLLLKAAKASDQLERMLAITRSVLCLLTDILRPGKGFRDTPVVILGQHYLSSRELGERFRGDQCKVFLQELCVYDPKDRPTKHKKLDDPSHIDIARLYMHMTPVSRAKIKKDGIMSSTTTAYLEVSFEGEGTVILNRFGEEYSFSFPSLLFTDPLSKECSFDFDGRLMVTCKVTGLQSVIKFKPWSEHTVKGYVQHKSDHKTTEEARVAKIEGSWDGQLTAEGIDTQASGILFDAAEFQPPMLYPLAINLAEPGALTMTRLWSSILEAILYTDGQQQTLTSGKKAAELVAALPFHMKKSLLYEIPEGPKPASKAAAAAATGDDEGDSMSLTVARDKRPLPPAAKLQRAQGRSLGYQLQYSVKAVPPIDNEEEESFTFNNNP